MTSQWYLAVRAWPTKKNSKSIKIASMWLQMIYQLIKWKKLEIFHFSYAIEDSVKLSGTRTTSFKFTSGTISSPTLSWLIFKIAFRTGAAHSLALRQACFCSASFSVSLFSPFVELLQKYERWWVRLANVERFMQFMKRELFLQYK